MRTQHYLAGLLALAGLLLAPRNVHAGNCVSSSAAPEQTGQTSCIPIQIYRNFLVVAEGQIGGLPGPMNFVLDTGSSPSVINAKLATRLGLAAHPSSSIALGTLTSMQVAILPEVDLGTIRATSLPVLIDDLAHLESDFGVPIAGILGMDVLSKSDFTLDYDARQIEFGDVSHQGAPVNYDAHAGIAVASVRIGNRLVRLLVDTGAEHVVLLGGNFGEVRSLELRDTSQSGSSLADSKMRIQKFSAPEISVGGRKFSSDTVYFVPGKTDPVFDGLLGIRALGLRKISYDRECQTIFLE
jgi:predicted aspartyl protease